MSAWVRVVTEPLGLVGFALFLVFAFLGKLKSGDSRRWIAPTAFCFAAVTLCSGLALAYMQVMQPAQILKPPPAAPIAPPSASASSLAAPSSVHQSTTGPGGANINGVQGNVTYEYDASTGKTEVKKSPGAKR